MGRSTSCHNTDRIAGPDRIIMKFFSTTVPLIAGRLWFNRPHMKYTVFKRSIVFTAIVFLSFHFGYAQQKTIDSLRLYFPGPVNQDSSKYATIFVTRSASDPNPYFWQEIYIDRFPMARIMCEAKYIIYCAKQGATEIGCGTKDPLRINISPGEKIYISMTIEGTGKKIAKLEQLDRDDGEKKFNSSTASTIRIYDPDPMEYIFHGEKLQSWYTRDEAKAHGFNEFTFAPPISVRHYFGNADLGYLYSWANLWVSPSYSEFVWIQRMGDYDFNSMDEFKDFVKSKIEKADKKLLKKSETVTELTYTDVPTPADLSFASYVVTQDTRPQSVDLKGRPYLEVRTWQAYMYKKKIKKGKGRIFQVTFSERGFGEELHSKEEIFCKMNLLLQSSEFGVVRE